jgi:hypothetical protein
MSRARLYRVLVALTLFASGAVAGQLVTLHAVGLSPLRLILG